MPSVRLLVWRAPGLVENVGDRGEGLVFVGAANVLVGFDFSVERVSLIFGLRGTCWV